MSKKNGTGMNALKAAKARLDAKKKAAEASAKKPSGKPIRVPRLSKKQHDAVMDAQDERFDGLSNKAMRTDGANSACDAVYFAFLVASGKRPDPAAVKTAARFIAFHGVGK